MTREELIIKLNKKEVPQSYSSLKHFTSPLDYLKYKLDKKSRGNAGMEFGSLCDCLLLTPGDVEKKFAVCASVATTPLQVAFSEELIDLMKAGNKLTEAAILKAYGNNYKSGAPDKVYAGLKDYIAASAAGKQVVSAEVMEEAKALTAKLLSYDDVKILFSKITGVQQYIEWDAAGWKMRGYLDFTIPESIFDLKYSDSADPEKFLKQISKLGYDLQAGAYCRGSVASGLFEEQPAYHFLVYDKTANYSIIELDYSFIGYGMRKLDYHIQALNRCVAQNAWDQSYNFFQRKYKAYKPAWARGYVLEGEEVAE